MVSKYSVNWRDLQWQAGESLRGTEGYRGNEEGRMLKIFHSQKHSATADLSLGGMTLNRLL